jgi:hypothetical protein
VDLEMDLVNKFGLMEQNILVNGEKIKLMEKENLSMLMETFTTDSGLMIKRMVLEHIDMSMALCMKASGKMIFNMEKVSRHGLIRVDMRVNMLTVANTASVLINGVMEANIQGTGKKIKLVDLVFTLG